jgi:hypothetical protein
MNDVFYTLVKEAETLAYAELLGMPKTSHPWEDIFRQKYGELVVKRCIEMIEPDKEHRQDAQWGYIGGEEGVELLDGCVRAIKEHFEMDETK